MIALGIATWFAGHTGQVFERILPTGILAITGGEVEEGMTPTALPGHHVDDIRLAPAQSTSIVDMP